MSRGEQARPDKAAERAGRLLEFFGHRTLDEITGALCREYVSSRDGMGRATKKDGGKRGSGGGARRDLEDLRAAIGHHHREGLHREDVRVVFQSIDAIYDFFLKFLRHVPCHFI